MSSDTPQEKWRFQVAKLKLMFPHLDEDDFLFDYGMKDVMMNNLQAKLGKSREELNEMLSSIKE